MIKILSLNQKKSPFYKIEDIKLKKKKKFKVKITEKIHKKFIKLSGDDSPIHNNEAFIKKNNFKKKLGHGFLITVILSQIYGKYFPGGRELCVSQTCFFRNPFFINDILEIVITPNKKINNFKLLEISIEIFVKKKIIFNGEATFILSLNK